MDFGRDDYNRYFSKLPEPENNEVSFGMDEPMFLLRASDPLAPKILLDYATTLRLTTKNTEVSDSVIRQAQKMIDWQTKHPTKYADFIHEQPEMIKNEGRIQELVHKLELGDKLSAEEFEQLEDLVITVHGKGAFKLALKDDMMLYPAMNPGGHGIIETYGFVNPDDFKSAKLVIGITPSNEMIIMKNEL